jgi:hypothetical protein
MARCTPYSIYVIKFVSDLKQVGGVLRVLNTDCHDITKILLKVALNTISLAHPLKRALMK